MSKSKTPSPARQESVISALRRKISGVKAVRVTGRRMSDFLARRPHRSFKRTYRRDYVRSLQLPGYIAFTNTVYQLLWKHKGLFIKLVLVYAAITAVAAGGIASQDLYAELRDTIDVTGADMLEGVGGEISKASLLLAAGVTGGLSGASAELQPQQQAFGAIVLLLTWLTTVWLLRAVMAERTPKLRDGAYNAGAPILATFLVSLVLIIQLLPLALAIFGYNAAAASGLLNGGVEAMLFWAVAALLTALSLYWLTSTLIALVVVTLPGMYPMQALRTAGDLVIGRRVRILLRMLWMAMVITVLWALIAIPVILFDGWIKSVLPAIAWLPLVPVTLLIMSSLTVVWSAAYVYVLYRKVVDDDAAPA